jgi:hypothetical protein
MTAYRERHLAGLTSAEPQDTGLTVAQLKKKLVARGLATNGNKKELEQRLSENR